MGCGNGKAAGKKAAAKPAPNGTAKPPGQTKQGSEDIVMVMKKYRMSMQRDDIMGEGTSSICRKATNVATGGQVAVKVYKAKSGAKKKDEEVTLTKFKRQIAVLKDLQEPFKQPSDPDLWSEQMSHAKPSRLFLQLYDYSKDAQGQPGPDPTDNTLYVVTELAQYSLKDYFAFLHEQCKVLSKEQVQNIVRAVVLVVAGLHAKGYVHLDLKPENLMMFNGRLKLIDVDGCLKAGQAVSIQDSSVSFSPCYCAPEWARFLIEAAESRINVVPALDVWSVGMTICELVTLDAILKPMYASFLRNGHSHREAGFLFMDWLGSVKKAPIPKAVEQFDPQFTDLLTKWLLVFEPTKRKSLAQALSHPYLAVASANEEQEDKAEAKDLGIPTEEESVSRAIRNRAVDNTNKAPIFKASLYKLDSTGNPQNQTHWRKRDMWIAHNGSLCYWSIKDEKRLVLIEGATLQGAKIRPLQNSCREHAFELTVKAEDDAGKEPTFRFACESEDDYKTWRSKLLAATRLDNVNMTLRLGKDMKDELDKFRVTVKNRRMIVDENNRAEFEPAFKGNLWKLKAEGDLTKAEDWFEREMWISKNGSLVYYSKKEERNLVYFTKDDLSKATYAENQAESCKKWAFRVTLPASDEVEFTPGEFAANSEEERKQWMAELQKLTA